MRLLVPHLLADRQMTSAIAATNRVESTRTLFRDLTILVCLVLITRIPLLGIAEPDSALFATGARQWLGAGAHAVSIYSAKACAFYYVAVAILVHKAHLDTAFCATLMSVLSLAGGLVITIFGYLIGVQLVGARPAFRAMLLFAVSPGLWWVTVEPHPQAVSIAFGILGIWSFLRNLKRRSIWSSVASAIFFAFAIAVKNDAILMLPALLAIAFWVDPTWRSAVKAVFTGGAAALVALCLSRLAVNEVSGSVAGGREALATFWRIPTITDFVKDLAPIAFGIGLVTAAVMGIAVLVGLFRDSERRRWAIMLALWSVPGYLFWVFIAGNNIRHVLAFGIPLFYFGAKYLNGYHISACLALSFLIPGNSNVFMFPSPNVPASAHLFAQKQEYLRSVADELSQQHSCFVGSYTSDYLVTILLEKGGRINDQRSETDTSAASITMPNDAEITFKRIGTDEKSVALGSCQSVEYDRNGHKTRLFGAEWHVPVI